MWGYVPKNLTLEDLKLKFDQALTNLEASSESYIKLDDDLHEAFLNNWDDLNYDRRPVGFGLDFLCCTWPAEHGSAVLVIPIGKGEFLIEDHWGNLNDPKSIADLATGNNNNCILKKIIIFEEDNNFIGIDVAIQNKICTSAWSGNPILVFITNQEILDEIDKIKKERERI